MSNPNKGNLLIAQGGGPTAVINCSLYGVIRQAQEHPNIGNILGARHGIVGLLNEEFINCRTQPKKVIEGLQQTPASALGSCRHKVTTDDYEQIMTIIKRNNIRYFIYIGGNDSMDTAHQIHQLAQDKGYELFACGVPKTIDNDLPLTDHCPGYGSAARYIAQSVRDAAMDVRSLPTPISIFEVMGRNAGWLAAAASLAKTDADSGPHKIYLPETPFDIESFLANIESLHGRLGWALVVVGEGIKTAQGVPVYQSEQKAQADSFGHQLPGDVASFLAQMVTNKLNLRCRSEKPGLCSRSSIYCVSAVDQQEAQQVGRAAVELVVNGQSGLMTTLVRQSSPDYQCTIGNVPLANVANVEKLMPKEFIDTKNNFVTDAFYDYAKPLIGEELLCYSQLS